AGRAVRGAGGGGRWGDAEAGGPVAADTIGRGAGKPDQPVPVQQGGRRKRYQGRQVTTIRIIRNLILALLLAGAAGCATTNGGDSRDPLEGFNRAMYSFNDGFDNAIGKPIATVYRDVLPDPIRGFVRNFFANIADL